MSLNVQAMFDSVFGEVFKVFEDAIRKSEEQRMAQDNTQDPIYREALRRNRETMRRDQEANLAGVTEQDLRDGARVIEQAAEMADMMDEMRDGLVADDRTVERRENKSWLEQIEIAPRFEDRPGGYTRILKLAKPRLGDAGTRAILEFVGRNDRVRRRAERPAFETDTPAPEAQTAAQS